MPRSQIVGSGSGLGLTGTPGFWTRPPSGGGGGSSRRSQSSGQGLQDEQLLRLLEQNAGSNKGLFDTVADTGKGLLNGALDVIGTPGFFVNSVISEGLDDFSIKDVIQKTRDNYSFFNLMEDEMSFTDDWNPWVKGLAGFAGAVLTDPLTYIAPGSSLLKTGAKQASGRLLEHATGEVLASGKFVKGSDDFFRAIETHPMAIEGARVAKTRSMGSLSDEARKIAKLTDTGEVAGKAQRGIYWNVPGTGSVGRRLRINKAMDAVTGKMFKLSNERGVAKQIRLGGGARLGAAHEGVMKLGPAWIANHAVSKGRAINGEIAQAQVLFRSGDPVQAAKGWGLLQAQAAKRLETQNFGVKFLDRFSQIKKGADKAGVDGKTLYYALSGDEAARATVAGKSGGPELLATAEQFQADILAEANATVLNSSKSDLFPDGDPRSANFIEPGAENYVSRLLNETGREAFGKTEGAIPRGGVQAPFEKTRTLEEGADWFGTELKSPAEAGGRSLERQVKDILIEQGIPEGYWVDDFFVATPTYVTSVGKRVGEEVGNSYLRARGLADYGSALTKKGVKQSELVVGAEKVVRAATRGRERAEMDAAVAAKRLERGVADAEAAAAAGTARVGKALDDIVANDASSGDDMVDSILELVDHHDEVAQAHRAALLRLQESMNASVEDAATNVRLHQAEAVQARNARSESLARLEQQVAVRDAAVAERDRLIAELYDGANAPQVSKEILRRQKELQAVIADAEKNIDALGTPYQEIPAPPLVPDKNGMVTLYHGTLEYYLPQIEAEGLIASDGLGVYVTSDPARAEMWSLRRYTQDGEVSGPIVVEIKVPIDSVSNAARNGEYRVVSEDPVMDSSIWESDIDGPRFEEASQNAAGTIEEEWATIVKMQQSLGGRLRAAKQSGDPKRIAQVEAEQDVVREWAEANAHQRGQKVIFDNEDVQLLRLLSDEQHVAMSELNGLNARQEALLADPRVQKLLAYEEAHPPLVAGDSGLQPRTGLPLAEQITHTAGARRHWSTTDKGTFIEDFPDIGFDGWYHGTTNHGGGPMDLTELDFPYTGAGDIDNAVGIHMTTDKSVATTYSQHNMKLGDFSTDAGSLNRFHLAIEPEEVKVYAATLDEADHLFAPGEFNSNYRHTVENLPDWLPVDEVERAYRLGGAYGPSKSAITDDLMTMGIRWKLIDAEDIKLAMRRESDQYSDTELKIVDSIVATLRRTNKRGKSLPEDWSLADELTYRFTGNRKVDPYVLAEVNEDGRRILYIEEFKKYVPSVEKPPTAREIADQVNFPESANPNWREERALWRAQEALAEAPRDRVLKEQLLQAKRELEYIAWDKARVDPINQHPKRLGNYLIEQMHVRLPNSSKLATGVAYREDMLKRGIKAVAYDHGYGSQELIVMDKNAIRRPAGVGARRSGSADGEPSGFVLGHDLQIELKQEMAQEVSKIVDDANRVVAAHDAPVLDAQLDFDSAAAQAAKVDVQLLEAEARLGALKYQQRTVGVSKGKNLDKKIVVEQQIQQNLEEAGRHYAAAEKVQQDFLSNKQARAVELGQELDAAVIDVERIAVHNERQVAQLEGDAKVATAEVLRWEQIHGKWDGNLNGLQADGIETMDDLLNRGLRLFGKNTLVPEDMAEILMGVTRLRDPDWAKKFLKTYDAVQNLWKGYATTSPGFISRNLLGGVFNNTLAGMRFEAYRMFIRGQQGKSLPPQWAAAYKRLIESGIVKGGQTVGEVAHTVGASTLARRGNPLTTDFAPIHWSRLGSHKVEELLRGALFMDTFALTDNFDEALGAVNKFHFDYNDLSATERSVMRRVVPFYTWTRRNFPLQLEMLARKPKIYNRFSQAQVAIESQSQEEGTVPEYFGNNFATRLPWMKGGGNVYYMPDLPFTNMGEILDPRQAIANTSPFIKTPIELWSGKQFWQNQTFTEQYGRVPTGWEVVPGLMPALGAAGWATKNAQGEWMMKDRHSYAVGSLMPALAQARRLFPGDDKRYQDRVLTSWMGYLGAGLRTNSSGEKASQTWRKYYQLKDRLDILEQLGQVEDVKKAKNAIKYGPRNPGDQRAPLDAAEELLENFTSYDEGRSQYVSSGR